MILGVAQVVVNVADLDATAGDLLGRGYEESFRAERIPNAAGKAPLQGAERSELAMVHLTAPGGAMAVELTRYAGDPPHGRPAYALVFSPDGTVERALAEVADPDASAAFWRDGLGFRGDPGPDGAWQLEHPAMMPAWRLSLTLTRATGSDAGEPATVDADGCVLVTVLSTDVAADTARLVGLKARRATAVWDEHVAGRPLRVAMVEGPGGELVELLEMPRERAGAPSSAS